MIARYTRPEMGAIWSDLHKYECWLEVELAAAEALAELGEVRKLRVARRLLKSGIKNGAMPQFF
jgi:adenylosuccinate lyase